MANVDQNTNEVTAQLVLSGLTLIGASVRCKSSIMALVCLQLFPLCDGNGTDYRPSQDECTQISTVACGDEWQKIIALPGVRDQLPNCNNLRASSIVCEGACTFVHVCHMPYLTIRCARELNSLFMDECMFFPVLNPGFCQGTDIQFIWARRMKFFFFLGGGGGTSHAVT